MKRILLILVMPILATGATTSDNITCNSIPGYIVDTDQAGLNIRDAPHGKVIAAIPAKYIPALSSDPGMHAGVTVIGSDGDGWLRVRVVKYDYDKSGIVREKNLIPGGEGWVFSRLIATTARGYSDADTHLYATPSKSAEVIGSIHDVGGLSADEILILDCKGDFFLTEAPVAPHFKTRKLGWLHVSASCGTPLTTCP